MRRHFLAFYKVSKYRDNAPLKIINNKTPLTVFHDCRARVGIFRCLIFISLKMKQIQLNKLLLNEI